MGLSSDPVKRRRQLENLAVNNPTLAARLREREPGKPGKQGRADPGAAGVLPADEDGSPSARSIERVRHDDDPAPRRKTSTRRTARTSSRRREREPERTPSRELPREGEGDPNVHVAEKLPGFVDGLLAPFRRAG